MKCGKGNLIFHQKSKNSAPFSDSSLVGKGPFPHFILHLLSRLLCVARLQPKVVKTVRTRTSWMRFRSRPEELVGRLAIREATVEVVSRGCRHSESRRVPTAPFAMTAPRYGGPSVERTQTKMKCFCVFMTLFW